LSSIIQHNDIIKHFYLICLWLVILGLLVSSCKIRLYESLKLYDFFFFIAIVLCVG